MEENNFSFPSQNNFSFYQEQINISQELTEFKNENEFEGNITIEYLLQKLFQERKRVLQWRILNEATTILNSQLNSESLPLKFLKCALKLVSAEEAMLALKEEKGNYLKIFKYYPLREKDEERFINEKVEKPKGAIEIILQTGAAINRNANCFSTDELYGFSAIKKNLLGVPIFVGGRIIGALLMANKIAEKNFTQDDQDLLMILGAQLGIALENSRLYEKVDEKLQKKYEELKKVNEILIEQHKVLTRSLEIHKQLTELALTGKGIEAICHTLTDIIDNPVQVEDQNFEVIATTMDKMIHSFISGKDLMERKEFDVQIKILFQDKKPVELFLDSDTIQYMVPIIAGETILGLIITVLVKKKLSQLDRVALEQGATIIALEMLKQRATIAHFRRLKENFIEQILEKNYESEEWIQHRAMQLNFNLKDTYELLIVDIEPVIHEKSRPEFYQEIKEFCENFSPNNIVIIKYNFLLILVTVNEKDEGKGKAFAELLKKKLFSLARDGRWWIALGTKCNKLSDCYLSYHKALTALEIIKALGFEKIVIDSNNLGIFSILEINTQRFAEFTQKTLGPLLEYDRRHKTQLIETLMLYYKYNGNVLKAARKGYLNPSTLKYRLRRIQEITGLDLKDTETSLQLQIALKLVNCCYLHRDGVELS